MDVRDFGQRIYRLRLARKWTQVGCATRAQISIGTLQMIEAHKVQPTVDTVRKLALAFGCSWEDLLGPVRSAESSPRKAKTVRRGP